MTLNTYDHKDSILKFLHILYRDEKQCLIIKPGAVLNLWNSTWSLSKDLANISLAESDSIIVLGFFTNTFESDLGYVTLLCGVTRVEFCALCVDSTHRWELQASGCVLLSCREAPFSALCCTTHDGGVASEFPWSQGSCLHAVFLKLQG